MQSRQTRPVAAFGEDARTVDEPFIILLPVCRFERTIPTDIARLQFSRATAGNDRQVRIELGLHRFFNTWHDVGAEGVPDEKTAFIVVSPPNLTKPKHGCVFASPRFRRHVHHDARGNIGWRTHAYRIRILLTDYKEEEML